MCRAQVVDVHLVEGGRILPAGADGDIGDERDALQQLGLVRADVSGEALGLMVVGTYLMVTRQLVISRSKPDLAAMVQAVGLVVSQGIAPASAPASAPRAAAPARARQRGSKRSIR